MKKKRLLLLTVLPLLLVGCNPTTNEEENGGEITNPDEPSGEKEYTYKTPKTYDGVINSSISYDVLSNIGVDLDIFSSYVTLTYQEVDGEVLETDYDKAFKFHMNLDLYSIKETYESSLLTSTLLPSSFNEFKYQNILNNVSDLDLYYLADGNLYTTISRFENNQKPARGDKEALKNYKREIIGTSKMDISAILEMMNPSSTGSSSLDMIFSQFFSILNGFTIDFSLIDNIISSTLLEFIDGGFKVNFKEDGLTSFSYIFNIIASYIFKNNDIGLTIDEEEPLINITNAEIEVNPLEIKASFEDENSLKPLFYLSLTRNDSKELNIEPPFNLEEDYLIQLKALDNINMLYEIYDNYSFESGIQTEIKSLIQNINNLSEDEKKRVENFNNYLGYPLLKEENDQYVSLIEEDNLNKLKNDLATLVTKKVNNDASFIDAYRKISDIFSSKYSISTKYNILNSIAKTNEERFNEFKNEIQRYMNSFVDPIKKEITTLLNEYNNGEDKTIEDKHELIEKIYTLTVLPVLVLENNRVINIEDFKEGDKIKVLSSEIINNTINYLSLTSSLIDETLSQSISNILLDYFNDLTLYFNKLSEKELTKFNDYASYLLVNEDKDNLYEIFNLVSNNNSAYYLTLKRKNDELINLLISKVDKFANKRIDESVTSEEIYYMLNINRLNEAKTELDSIFSMLNNFISSPLFKNYSSSLTYIDKYYLLVDLINKQITNLS